MGTYPARAKGQPYLPGYAYHVTVLGRLDAGSPIFRPPRHGGTFIDKQAALRNANGWRKAGFEVRFFVTEVTWEELDLDDPVLYS